jgi:oxygen-independent coproporphyrinogen-3 oxidase
VTSGLYIHLPFCRVHCTYCPFAISTDIGLQDAYVAALVREIAARANGERVDSIYFGGGTPSRTSIENLRNISVAICASFDVADDAEFSTEANPEDVSRESIAAWRALGVNRVSIGVQSFDDRELEAIGRIHDSQRAHEAVTIAVDSGVRTSLDLILGLPHQTPSSFERTLDTAISLGAGHLSLYILDLEEGTPLHAQVARGRIDVGDDDMVATLYARAIEKLSDAGFAQYEVSNFAREGEQCRHNMRYWRRGEYLGLGLGAHSFVNEERFSNTRNIQTYIGAPEAARDFIESLGEPERKRETLFLGLRQSSGVSYDLVVRLCGQEGVEWIERGLRDGWLRRADERVAFTSSGFLLSNDYISQLF